MPLTIYKDSTFKEIGDPPLPAICPMLTTEDSYFLERDYYICIDLNGAKIEIFIPRGFVFDGASIPRLFWRIIGHPFHPKRVIAALIHDALYGKIHNRVKIMIGGYILESIRAMKFFTRGKTDAVLEGLLIICGNSKSIVYIMHRAVRFGGFFAFRKSENKFITKEDYA